MGKKNNVVVVDPGYERTKVAWGSRYLDTANFGISIVHESTEANSGGTSVRESFLVKWRSKEYYTVTGQNPVVEIDKNKWLSGLEDVFLTISTAVYLSQQEPDILYVLIPETEILAKRNFEIQVTLNKLVAEADDMEIFDGKKFVKIWKKIPQIIVDRQSRGLAANAIDIANEKDKYQIFTLDIGTGTVNMALYDIDEHTNKLVVNAHTFSYKLQYNAMSLTISKMVEIYAYIYGTIPNVAHKQLIRKRHIGEEYITWLKERLEVLLHLLERERDLDKEDTMLVLGGGGSIWLFHLMPEFLDMFTNNGWDFVIVPPTTAHVIGAYRLFAG